MIKILGISLYDKGIKAAVENVIQISKKEEKLNRCISATGAHGLVTAKRDRQFKSILESFWCNLPDGMPGVWIGRLKSAKEMDRCYGPDFFKNVMQETADKHINHYFCGGKNGVAEELRIASAKSFRNTNIIGCFSPPFRDMLEGEIKELADQINSLKTDIVWIGLSTPKQEIFASKLAKYTNVHFIITVGAAFDFHTGKVIQAPKILQLLGLEWLFRLMMEPKRLYSRYLEIVPLFIYYNLEELVRYLLSKRK